ncbi:DUF4349 domain-containing protein [Leucobacter luti]|uniref:Uncharacterized protein DUF4349 n=1 Tax=Leucobacter luti TaxID=340320 RepID=A0A4Q7U5C0_9MICO|nr:DUF4349 domain-containing protein [Leucobacter luti]MBL3700964.1 DUF4349 domain-containing protein [Leucobacter luti]RZT68814.1 uncharacterized protein DUF4349 [Leucobacter luti]
MNRRRTLAVAAASALLLAPLSACSALTGPLGASSSNSSGPVDAGAALPDVAGGAEAGSQFTEQLDAPGREGVVDRSVIRTGDLSLTVSDVGAASDQAAQITVELGGSVESQLTEAATGTSPASATLSLRVPADSLDVALTRLSEVGTVVSQSRSATDVTTEHVDLQARVTALEASVERLTKLIDGATSTSDLIEAEAALSDRQQELDGLRAQLTSLEGSVDEATIWVSLTTPSVLPGGGPTTFWDGLGAGIASLGAAASGAVVVLGILLPWLVLAGMIAGAIVWIVRATRTRRARRGPVTASSTTDPASDSTPTPDPGQTPTPDPEPGGETGPAAADSVTTPPTDRTPEPRQ